MNRHFGGLARDIVVYGLMSGISQVITFLLLPILTRVFSTREYGIVEILTTLTGLVATFSTFSMPSAVARFFKESEAARTTKTLVFNATSVIFSLGVVFVIGISVFRQQITTLILGSQENSSWVILAAMSGALSALTFIPEMVLRMKRRIVAYNAINILFSVSYAILALVFVLNMQLGVYGIFAAMLTANILQYTLGVFLIRDSIDFSFSWHQLTTSLRFAFPLFPAALVTWVNRQTDRLILLAFLGLSNVAIFGVGSRLAGVINLLAAIFRQAWVPFSLSVIEEGDEKTRDLFYSKVANYFISFFFAISICIVAVAPDVIRILFPPDYAQAALVVPWLLGATILHASGDFTNLGTVISKKTVGNSIAAVTGAITNVLLAFMLIPRFGIAGASIGVFAAEFLFTAILWWFSYRSSKISFDTKTLLTIIGGYCVASILILQVTGRVDDALLSLATRLLIGALFAFFFFRLGVDDVAKELVKKFLSRLKRTKEPSAPAKALN